MDLKEFLQSSEDHQISKQTDSHNFFVLLGSLSKMSNSRKSQGELEKAKVTEEELCTATFCVLGISFQVLQN